jgi:hypothetical protein
VKSRTASARRCRPRSVSRRTDAAVSRAQSDGWPPRKDRTE